MASYCEVFARKEKKYRLNAQQCRFMLASLEGRMEADSFGKTKITSLYYDTPDRRLIARSLEKPVYKEKLRVRRYGVAEVGEAGFAGAAFSGASSGGVEVGEAGSGEADPTGAGFGEACAGEESRERVFIEIKKKYKGIVYKRRVACSVAAARAYLSGAFPYELACRAYPLASERAAVESVSPRSIQISREIDQFLTRYETLVPSMTIACSRIAYVPVSAAGADARIARADATDAGVTAGGAGTHAAHANAADADLRITFDTDLSCRDELRGAPYARPLLSPGEAIMEIKAGASMPMWLSHALSECRAYPSSFSKYGAAYCKSIAEERVMHCA